MQYTTFSSKIKFNITLSSMHRYSKWPLPSEYSVEYPVYVKTEIILLPELLSLAKGKFVPWSCSLREFKIFSISPFLASCHHSALPQCPYLGNT
jgi:hypothetical protein